MFIFRNELLSTNGSKYIILLILIILSTIFSTLMGAFLKYVQKDLDVYTAGFYRYIFGLLIILPQFYYSKNIIIRFNNIKLHIFRSLLAIPAMYFGLSAIANLQLEKYIAIYNPSEVIIITNNSEQNNQDFIETIISYANINAQKFQ